MKKNPYIISAYVQNSKPAPAEFLTDTHLQTAAHAAGVGEHLQIQVHAIPAIRIEFTAPSDPLTPEYPEQKAQDAMVRLLNAEIRQRWPGSQPKFKLYQP